MPPAMHMHCRGKKEQKGEGRKADTKRKEKHTKTKSSQSHHLPFVHLIHASVTFGASWDQALCSGMQLPHLSEMRCSHSGFLVTSRFFPPSPCVCGFLCGCSFCIQSTPATNQVFLNILVFPLGLPRCSAGYSGDNSIIFTRMMTIEKLPAN